MSTAPESKRFGWSATLSGDTFHVDHHNYFFGLWAAARWAPATGSSDLSAAFDLTRAFPSS